jgi:small GTP-binding protein
MSEFVFKVVAIGDGGVGKTSIAVRYTYDKFDPKYKATIGVSYAVKKLVHGENNITLSILDTGGQEMFDYIRPFYYKGASGAIIVYDVTRKATFDHLDKWFNNLFEQCGKIPVILVGNKTDLIDERVVSAEQGEEYAQQKGVAFHETSAKTGENVIDVMNELAKVILSDKMKVKVLTEQSMESPKKRKRRTSRFIRRLFR